MNIKKTTRLLFSMLLLLFTMPSFATEQSLEMQYCQATSGHHQRTLENCLYLMGSVAQHQISEYAPDGYMKNKMTVEVKCKAVSDQLDRDGVGSAGAIVIAECFANNWASIRNKMFEMEFE